MGGSIGFHTYLAAGLLLIGIMDDLRSRKVHNPLILFALGLSIACVLLNPNLQIIEALKSLAFAFALGLPLYCFRVIGGGDFKLMVAVAPLIPAPMIFYFFVWALFWGALLSLSTIILRGQWKAAFHNMVATLMHRRAVAEARLQKVPFTVAIFFGFLSIALSAPFMGG